MNQYEKLALKLKNKLEDVVFNFKSIYGDKFDYSLIIDYDHNKQKLPVICKKHNLKFFISYNKHFSNKQNGCKKCKGEKIATRNSISNDEFLKRAKKRHGDRYSYLECYVDSYTKIRILCNKCFSIFDQHPGSHIYGRGCPFCKSSKAEMKIRNFLESNNVYNLPEYTFDGCRGKKRSLPFDFYLPNHNTCIEFDGIQHFRPIHFIGKKVGKSITKKEIDNFLITVENDKIKNEFCKIHEIKLIRIPFWEFNNIEKIIELNFNGICL